jgi:hypothetical protein
MHYSLIFQCVFCFVGLLFPIVIPPVREVLGYSNVSSPKSPPPVKELIAKAQQGL